MSSAAIDAAPLHFSVAVTRDVLAIDVDVPSGVYPSVNHIGLNSARRGRKTKEYHQLFDAVLRAGQAALTAGWAPITSHASVSVTRYVCDRRTRDALNIGAVEANALTKAGVWLDDTLAAPITLDIQTDPNGPDRVSIVIIRGFARESAPRAASTPRSQPTARRNSAAEPTALLDGKPIPLSEALKLIQRR